MKLIYAREEIEKEIGKKAIFLAGPTPRKQEIKSWRPEAIEILEKLGFEGEVYIPEDRSGNVKFDYLDQVEWEKEGLTKADVIVFWIPRDLENMPAFTTNVEFGYWIKSGKIVYGRPDNARKNKYLDWLYESEYDKKAINDLNELMKQSVIISENK